MHLVYNAACLEMLWPDSIILVSHVNMVQPMYFSYIWLFMHDIISQHWPLANGTPIPVVILYSNGLCNMILLIV